jgi:hypothetical protein
MRNLCLTVLILVGTLSFSVLEAPSQTNEGRQKSQEIAALFNKTKHKVKEKRGVRLEVFVDIKSEPVVKGNVSEYSGRYKSDTDDWLDLKVSANGQIEAVGSEPSPQNSRRFRLKDARIEGALLTAMKVYEDGSTEKFEAAFLNRTVRVNQNDAGTTVFGIGVRFDPPKTDSSVGFVINKLFYELK